MRHYIIFGHLKSFTSKSRDIICFMSLCKYLDETRQTGKLFGNHIKDRGTVSNPHTDASPAISNYNTLACLCYLSKDIHGGTGLYYNKQLQTFCTNWDFENEDRWNLWKKVQAVTTDKEKLVIIRNHYTDRGNKLYPNLRTDRGLLRLDIVFSC